MAVNAKCLPLWANQRTRKKPLIQSQEEANLKKSFYGNSASRMCFEPYTRFKTEKHVTLWDKAKRRSVMSVTYKTHDWQLFPYDVNRTDRVNTSLVGRVGLITRSVEFVILMLYINLSHSHLFHTSFMARLSYLSFSVMCELLFSC